VKTWKIWYWSDQNKVFKEQSYHICYKSKSK